jgi:hypothetical protein
VFDFLDGLVKNFIGFTAALAVALLVAIAVLVTVRRITGRKQIIFDAWVDLRPQPDEPLGRSLAEMLLYRLRAIQWVHERSVERVEISNLTGMSLLSLRASTRTSSCSALSSLGRRLELSAPW